MPAPYGSEPDQTSPDASAPQQSTGLAVPLSAEQIAEWRKRLDASAKVAKEKRDQWKALVAAYMTRVLKETPQEPTAVIPLEFAYVELKKSQLAFQVPEVTLRPKRPGLEQAVVTFKDGLNTELGPEGANCDALLNEIVTDVLLCGIGASELCYYADIRTRKVPVMQPMMSVYGVPMTDPQTGQPLQDQAVDPATGEPQMQDEQYVAEECFEWDRFPPEDLRVPVEFEGSDYDKAAWLGRRFRMDVDTAIRVFKLPPDFQPSVTSPRDTLSSDEQPDRAGATVREVEGDKIWYRTQVFDAKAGAMKDARRRLILLDNHDKPVVHEDSPYQFFDESDGRLKGMKGFPIHPLTLRFLPGSAYPMSDVEVTRPIAEEESKYVSQTLQFRDRSMPFIGVDRTRMSPDDKRKIENNLWKPNAVHGFDGPVQEVVGVMHLGSYPRENIEFARQTRRNYELAWALQTSQTDQGEPPTATEIEATESSSQTRLNREQLALLKWFVKGATKYASLLLQFVDEPRWAEIVGPDGAKSLQAWNRTSAGGRDAEYIFDARPDAALRFDATQQFRQDMALYTGLGNDPNFNRAAFLKQMLTRHGKDASALVVDQLPDKGPEPPKLSFSFKGEDLSIAALQFPLVLAILQQGGVQIPPEAIENAKLLQQQLLQQSMMVGAAVGPGAPLEGQPPMSPAADTAHPGSTTPVAPTDKHLAERNLPPPQGGGEQVM